MEQWFTNNSLIVNYLKSSALQNNKQFNNERIQPILLGNSTLPLASEACEFLGLKLKSIIS